MTAAFDRRTGIGASEVPAISGLSPWSTPTTVWLDKVGLSAGRPSTVGMMTGTALERTVLRLAGASSETTLRHNRVTFRHPDWPEVPLFATPDGFGPGRWTAAEVKVVGYRGADWSDGPPAYVRAQVQAQMACIPSVQATIVGALLGSEVKTWRIGRDRAAGDLIAEAAAAWWREHVIAGVSPPPETDDDRWALAKAALTVEDRITRLASGDEEVLGAEIRVLMGESDLIARQIADRRLRLAEASAREDIAGVGWKASWHDRRTVDWQGLVAAERIPPRIVEAYTQTAQVFTFRRTSEKEPA